MTRAHALLRRAEVRADAVDVEDTIAVTGPAGVSLAPPDPAGRLRAAHHPARSVDGRVERLLVRRRLDSLEDHRLVAHRAAHEALLARAGRRAALPDHPGGAAEVLLPPSEVVVVVPCRR